MSINENLFDLTDEQIEMSISIYEGKVIKCLVAPYHTYDKLEKVIPFTKNTLLFPEREMTSAQCSGLISMIVASPSKEEFRIITANQNIILDMIDGCVRILTEGDLVVDCPTKTFMANIHDIRYNVLENKAHRISDEERSEARNKIQILIDKVQEGSSMTKSEYDDLLNKIDLVGEPIIRTKLREMAMDNITITDYSEVDAKIEKIQEEIERLKKLRDGL